MSKDRIIYLDIAKAVAIILVVWGHCLQNLHTDGEYWLTDPVSQIIISFHMPLFMMISGYFAYSSLKRSIVAVMKNKFYQLVIPSVSWFIIVASLAMAAKASFSIERVKEIILALPFSYWFLKSLFMCYLISMIGAAIYRYRPMLAIVYVVVVLIFGESLNYVSTISMLPFFFCGIMLRKYQIWIYSNAKWIMPGCMAVYCIMIMHWSGAEYNISTSF